MTNADFYQNIFKRKSFHLFRSVGDEIISQTELHLIEQTYLSFSPLDKNIQTRIRIIPAEQVHVGRGTEYCILLYSKKKDNYLMNIGYIGEQLDLYLVSRNIGSLWFGIGKPDLQTYQGLDFVIMIAIHKVSDVSMFRKDLFQCKRKQLDEIWQGETLSVAEIVRFAPSACNTQPWFVENKNGILTVYRYQKQGKRGIMPADKVSYYNRIDIGIFLLFLEVCLTHNGIPFEKTQYLDNPSNQNEKNKVAEYYLQ